VDSNRWRDDVAVGLIATRRWERASWQHGC
jgi:hypothetical protein